MNLELTIIYLDTTSACLEINIVQCQFRYQHIYCLWFVISAPTCSHGLCVVDLEAALGAGVPAAGVRPHVPSWTEDGVLTPTLTRY